MKLSRTSLGLAVRAAREAAKMTAGDLAKAVELDRSALSRIETGQRALEFGEAVAIARTVGVDVEILRTLAETFEREGASEMRDQQRKLEADLIQLQRLAVETAIENSSH